LQAYVDGELSARERRKVEQWLEQSAEARSTVEELRNTRSFLAGNEPEAILSESREFYWSKIHRQIERVEQPAFVLRPVLSPSWWLKYAMPLAAAAALALVATSPVWNRFTQDLEADELDGELQQASAFVFHSESEDMTVVWLQDDQIN
jgi:anti-sigma factor RsiW